jgi:AmmeMemoRadiSam system protein B
MNDPLRPAVFAGSWYPATADACKAEIERFLAEASPREPGIHRPVGGIVPHAGWVYSGAVACEVVRSLAAGPPPDVVAVFGAHLHGASPSVLMPAGAWETPFGPLPVAAGLAAELSARFPFRIETPARFAQDNTIELQLPFVKYFFPDAALLAAGLSPTEASLRVADFVVDACRRRGLGLRVLGSTDLTHYGEHYGFSGHGAGPRAVRWVRDENDRAVIEAMLALDPQRVMAEARNRQNACCPGAAAAAIQAGRSLGATKAETLRYATSYDRSPGDSFVGYVGVVFG